MTALNKKPIRLTLRRGVLACMVTAVLIVCGLSGLALSKASVHFEGPNNSWIKLGAAMVGIMEDDYCRDGYDHYSLVAGIEWPGQAQPFFYSWAIQRKTKCV